VTKGEDEAHSLKNRRKRKAGGEGHPAAYPALSRLKTRFVSCSTACAAKTALPNCAAVKASPRARITPGRRVHGSGKRRLAGDTARAATSGEVQDLRREARALKECVADLTLENRLLKKHDRGWGRRRMRYPASEKLEIIRIVEQSHLPAKLTLDKLGIARRTFYRWYDRFLEGGPEALEDRPSAPSRCGTGSA
jgi:hypothetical protein